MGKRIEDLGPLDDTPIDDDVRGQPWDQFVAAIDALLDSEEYTWATGTLQGIKETVERTRRVSDGQRRAVQNIAAAKQEPRREGWSRRRYEGHR